MEELTKNEKEEADCGRGTLEYDGVLKKFHRFAAIKKPTAREQLLVSKLKPAVAQLEEQIRAAADAQEAIRSGVLRNRACLIKIAHAAHPGTRYGSASSATSWRRKS